MADSSVIRHERRRKRALQLRGPLGLNRSCGSSSRRRKLRHNSPFVQAADVLIGGSLPVLRFRIDAQLLDVVYVPDRVLEARPADRLRIKDRVFVEGELRR